MEELLSFLIDETNYFTLIGTLLLVALGAAFVYRKKLKELWDTAYSKRKNREELIKSVAESQKAIKETQAEIRQIMDNRVHDRAQSFEIQKELTDSQQKLADSITSILKADETRDSQIASLVAANREVLADRINQKYKQYISLRGIPEDEVDEFTNLHVAYKGVGGNHSGDAKYEYVMMHLPIIPVEVKLLINKKEG